MLEILLPCLGFFYILKITFHLILVIDMGFLCEASVPLQVPVFACRFPIQISIEEFVVPLNLMLLIHTHT